jgi:predicted nucleotidyltransferase
MIPTLPTTAIRALCEKHNIRELMLFGSAARGDFSAETSDYDFLVEFMEPAKRDLFDHFDLQDALEDLLKRKVDLVSKRGLKIWIRDQVLAETKPVYYASA